jgi:mannan endo-1,4-beta-mannosidase
MKQAIRRVVRAVVGAWPVWVIPGVVMALAIGAVADLYGGGNAADGGRRDSAGEPAGGAMPVAPITANPNGSANANAVLDYLMSLPNRADDRIIAGQFAGTGDDASIAALESIYGDTGHWLGLLSADYIWSEGDFTRVNSLAKSYWNDGGLVTLSYHMPNVWTGGIYKDRTGIDIPAIIAPGTPERERWLAELDFLAAALGDLQEAGVVVLWRPLHEMNGTWSWWGGKLPGQFQALWRDMFDYLTHKKGLDNLLWVFSTAGSQKGPLLRYPGPEYVDIVGVDVYSELESACTTHPAYTEMLTLGKPVAFTEFGPGIGEENVEPYDWESLIGCIKSAHPETIYFMVWRGSFGLDNDSHRGVDALLEDPWIVNRSEVSWRPEAPSPAPDESSAYTDSSLGLKQIRKAPGDMPFLTAGAPLIETHGRDR